MNLAKVSANGQVTVPVEVRRRLNLKEGDKILFFERKNGEVIIDNASSTALLAAQKAFKNAAKDFGVNSDEDVQKLINGVRYGAKKRK